MLLKYKKDIMERGIAEIIKDDTIYDMKEIFEVVDYRERTESIVI